MYVPPLRALTVSLLAAFTVGGLVLTSGSSHASPVDNLAQAAGFEPVAHISTAATLHPVGMTHFEFSRGKDRPLPTEVWYPAAGPAQRAGARPRTTVDASPAAGRFPLIVWSHGLFSNPMLQQDIIRFFAENGFIVVGATYPHTAVDGPTFSRADIVNQPLDASYVLTQMLKPGNPIEPHIDATRMAAVGHSAGGTTTDGIFTIHRDPRFKAGIIISGRPQGAYQGSPVPLLFVHGDKDPVVAYSQGRQSYAADKWPKAFLTMIDTEHGAALGFPDRGHPQVTSTMIDFLRWTLDGSTAARNRMPVDGNVPGISHYEAVGIPDGSAPKKVTDAAGSTKGQPSQAGEDH